jgi:DNA-binding winged helix-turn-helix (wHTH) protein
VRYRSKDFVVDMATRQITRGRRVVHLSPKAFELLTTLLAERPGAISKAELQRRLWPDTFVSEANIAVLVAEIRSALGDRAHASRYVRTVHRFGYAFCGKVREEGRAASHGALAAARLILGSREVPWHREITFSGARRTPRSGSTRGTSRAVTPAFG